MSDEPTGAVSEELEEGQLSEQVSQEEPIQEEPRPEYVTVEQLEQGIERLERLIQSRTDRAEDRIKRAVDERLEYFDNLVPNLRAQGLSDQRIKELREEEILEASRSVLRDSSPAAQAGMDVSDLNRFIDQMAGKYGSILIDSDTELSGMQNPYSTDPRVWKAEYERRLKVKAGRLGRKVEAQSEEEEGTEPSAAAGARLVSSTRGAPPPDEISRLSAELKVLNASKNLDTETMKEIREKSEKLKQLIKRQQQKT